MNRKIWIGLALVVTSYGELLIPKNWALANHFAAGFPYSFAVALFVFGVIFLGEGVVQRFKGVSLLSLARGGQWPIIRFALVGAAVGLVLEVFAQWLGKLWFYAYYPSWFYWPSLVPSFLLYWVMITESYLAVKAILDHFIRRGGRETAPLRYYRFEPFLYSALGAVGAALFVFGTLRTVLSYVMQGGYVFNVLGPADLAPPLRYSITAFVGLWLVAEAVLSARQRPSLIRSLLHGYAVPALALLGASAVLSLVWESQNALVDYWVYTNWPWPNLTVFGVQLSVILMWPAHYVVYLMLPSMLVASWAKVFWTRPKAKTKGALYDSGL